ncbi:MAG TPA: rhomboid family intramembrane serine protease [Vicinamibacterales bacterium]|nr:rhomboid family intramembrane serine protease [Vicinamibacterales bacterium]
MIPVRTAIPSRTFPAATLTLIGLNIAGFLLARWVGAGRFHDTNPSGHWLTLLTHTNWASAAADFCCLWLFGDNVEDRTGRMRFVALYVACAGAGLLAAMNAHPMLAAGAAATAAVAGIVGAHFALFPQSRTLLLIPLPPAWTVEVPSLAIAGFWASLHLGLWILPALSQPGAAFSDIGMGGVIAGLALGALASRALAQPARMRPEWWHDGRPDEGKEPPLRRTRRRS